MFNPNALPTFSHREKLFGWLYQDTIDTFKEKFGLNKQIVLLITGSGTLANEVVIASSRHNYATYTFGQFSERLKRTQLNHYKGTARHNLKSMGVEYETGASIKNTCDNMHLADCISSFPYYNLPSADVCSTVTSKQLGAETGLSILILKDASVLDQFEEAKDSYLSLRRYYEKGLTHFTPNTPAISALLSFNTKLHELNLDAYRHNINSKRFLLENCLDKKGIKYYGTGPVFTIDRADVKQETVDRFNLYTNSGNVQLFLWSGTEKQIIELLKHL